MKDVFEKYKGKHARTMACDGIVVGISEDKDGWLVMLVFNGTGWTEPSKLINIDYSLINVENPTFYWVDEEDIKN